MVQPCQKNYFGHNVKTFLTCVPLHPSIKKIKENFHIFNRFHSTHTSVEEVAVKISEKDVKKQPPREASSVGPLLKIKISFRKYYATHLKMELIKRNSQIHLNWAEIKPTFKKDDRSDKEKCRSISLLTAVSKINEKGLYDQLNRYLITRTLSLSRAHTRTLPRAR